MKQSTKYANHSSVLLNNQRSIVIFQNAIKSKKTEKLYMNKLEQFLRYYYAFVKDCDSLLSINPKKLQTMIEDYIMNLKSNEKAKSTINCSISALDLFFSMNDVILNWKKIKKLMPEQKKFRGEKPYTTKMLQDVLKVFSKSFEITALIHVMASSGARVGFSEELQLKHIGEFEKNGCKSVKVYADSKGEYYTFINPEAVKALDDWFEYRIKNNAKLTPDSWVFPRPSDNSLPLTTNDINSRFSESCQNIDRGQKINGRYEIQICHGIRKRFSTILKSNKSINLSLAEKLLGHSSTIPLDNHYFKPTIDVLFDEYQKVIPELVVDETYRLKIELEKKDKEIQAIKSKDDRIGVLEKQLSEIREHLVNLSKKQI